MRKCAYVRYERAQCILAYSSYVHFAHFIFLFCAPMFCSNFGFCLLLAFLVPEFAMCIFSFSIYLSIPPSQQISQKYVHCTLKHYSDANVQTIERSFLFDSVHFHVYLCERILCFLSPRTPCIYRLSFVLQMHLCASECACQ